MTDIKVTSPSNKQVYQAVSNFIHNDFKFSRNDIIKIVESVVNKRVNDIFMDDGIHRLIRNTIELKLGDYIKSGVPGPKSYTYSAFTKTIEFDKWIRDVTKEVIKNELVDKLEINVSMGE